MVCFIAESEGGQLKNYNFQMATFAKYIGNEMAMPVAAVVFNGHNVEELADYGVDKVYNLKDSRFDVFDSSLFSEALKQVLEKEDFNYFIVGTNAKSRYLGAFLSVHFKAGFVSNIVQYPDSLSPFGVKHSVFSGKGFAYSHITSEQKVLSITKNTIKPQKQPTDLEVLDFCVDMSEIKTTTSLIEKQSCNNDVNIADADIVVSGGRGMKNAENWKILEELGSLLKGAMGCSKPISDMGWRPHSEHVGQTGKKISPKVYIAVGISGSIQHLAGISSAETKIVINNDPDAPFFKIADYGIVGDAFEVLPKLIEKIKCLKKEK